MNQQQFEFLPQIAALAVLQQQHWLGAHHGGAVKLHDVAVVGDGLEDADLLRGACQNRVSFRIGKHLQHWSLHSSSEHCAFQLCEIDA